MHGISLCMIVKNEEKGIERAIKSAKGFAREIIVVDTGSSDNTVQLAQKAGAQVYFYEWNNDFSAARNFSVSKAGCDWIFVLDADETIALKDVSLICHAIEDESADAYMMQQRNYSNCVEAEGWVADNGEYAESNGFAGYFDIPVVRLFRNNSKIFFEGVVHEAVLDSLRGLKKKFLDIPIHHFSSFDDQPLQEEKKSFYTFLLHKALDKNPEDEKNCILLGRQYYSLGEFKEAIFYLRKVILAGTRSEMAYDNLASAYLHLGSLEESRDVLEALLKINPRYAEAYVTLGVVYSSLGYESKAIDTLQRAVGLAPLSFKAQFNLAAAFYRQKNYNEALKAIIKAEELVPTMPRVFYLKFYILFNLKMADDAFKCACKLKELDKNLYEKIKDKVSSLEFRDRVSK